MKQLVYTIESNEPLTRDVYRLDLAGDASPFTKPGQFLDIRIDGCYLRRPLSVCRYETGRVTAVYKAVGKGTQRLSAMSAGDKLDILSGLGNGFDVNKSGNRPLLIGGGLGVSPLLGLCESLVSQGKAVTAVLGFNTAEEIVLRQEFQALGAKLIITTADGSTGVKGFAPDVMGGLDYSFFYTCGPVAMLAAVDKAAVTDGQFSFEERMGCGFGACMGCSCETKSGSKRICKDGPVLDRGEIIW